MDVLPKSITSSTPRHLFSAVHVHVGPQTTNHDAIESYNVKMATLTPRSAAAIARLRAYTAPPTAWGALPLTRRAAVLILLFADRRGELRVVLTMRANTLNNCTSLPPSPQFPSNSPETQDKPRSPAAKQTPSKKPHSPPRAARPTRRSGSRRLPPPYPTPSPSSTSRNSPQTSPRQNSASRPAWHISAPQRLQTARGVRSTRKPC